MKKYEIDIYGDLTDREQRKRKNEKLVTLIQQHIDTYYSNGIDTDLKNLLDNIIAKTANMSPSDEANHWRYIMHLADLRLNMIKIKSEI